MRFLRTFLYYYVTWLVRGYHFLWAFVSAVFYRFPSRDLWVIGVTGTKGKSTTVALLHHILTEAGHASAMISSVEVIVGKKHFSKQTHNTMPGRFYLQRFLREAVRAECRYAIIEVTSEGARLFRHWFIEWKGAVFLNLHPEHIESHGSFDEYRLAKLSFFTYARDCGAQFFINKDDANAPYFSEVAGEREVVSFGASSLPSLLEGTFNAYNVGAAVSVAQSLAIPLEVIARAVLSFKGVPGRMEHIKGEGYDIVVDYAHTPDSLEQVYATFRPKARRLICVLGSAGGGRDVWKREVFGKIADQYCDEIILTNEDPWDEEPEKIINDIERGVVRHTAHRIIDRREAIRYALQRAQKQDVVIITGKGSERVIHEAQGVLREHNDADVVRDLLHNFEL